MSSLANFIEGFFTFDWVKKGLASILGFLGDIMNSMTDFKVGKGPLSFRPFAMLDSATENLNNIVDNLRSNDGQSTTIELHQNIDGMPKATEQIKFDS